jgi:nicotinamide phosphoribosyltransferase
MSAILWQPITSATIARQYRKILTEWASKTSDIPEFVDWQGHDFSFRGMAGLESAMMSGAGHLLSFTGTDTIPALLFLEKYYTANVEKELVGGSVSATEHSVMCAGGKDGEFETFERLITEIYPSGIVSIVSDSWDLWRVLTEYLPRLNDVIVARDGKVVIRPDSGDPVDIICGKPYRDIDELSDKYITSGPNLFRFNGKFYTFFDKFNEVEGPEIKGVIELLWDTFGGTINSKGYKQLDPHIGAIYGDSITLERADEICRRLEAKGFASTNIVFGIGSFTYQYNTRDTFGMAMKATWVNVNGESREIFKDPITDDGTKKSAKGLLKVKKNADGKYELHDRVTYEESIYDTDLELVFQNGKLVKEQSLSEIRNRLKNGN